MALLTERALKRHKVAVITVEAQREKVLTGSESADFEWFNNADAAVKWLEDWNAFCKDDAENYTIVDGEDPAMAYLNIVIPDTASMEVGETFLFPESDITNRWKDELLADITVLFDTPEEKKKSKVTVKAPRRKAIALGGEDREDTEGDDEAPKPRRRAKITVKRDTSTDVDDD